MEFCCSSYNLGDLWLGYLTHGVTWLIDYVITWYAKKPFISTFARTMVTNLSKAWLKLSWPQTSNHVTHLSCDRVMQKGASPISQHQLPLNLVGLWIKVKEPHLLFQVTCRSSYHVLFEKPHVFTNARP